MRYQLAIIIAILLAAPISRGDEVTSSANSEVLAAVAVREEVFAAIRSGELRQRTKNFGWANPECRIHGYPILERSVFVDSRNRVRLYDRSQIVSHGAIERIRSYFDQSGQLRLVERRLRETIDRVHVSESGRILRSQVSDDDGESWRDSSGNFDDWYMKPRTPNQVEKQFMKSEPTCERGAG